MEPVDRILPVVDGIRELPENDDANIIWPEKNQHLTRDIPVTIVHNKCDLSGRAPGISQGMESTVIELSAKTGDGLALLKTHLKTSMGFEESGEGRFSARRRHLESRENAAQYLSAGQQQLLQAGAGELLADDLRQCQNALGEITGAVSSDDLLGEIFSSFCIGK